MTRGAAAAPRVLPPPREAGLISTLAFRMHGGRPPPARPGGLAFSACASP